MTFDPMKDIRFRGKPISELTHEETRQALVQALIELQRLNSPQAMPGFATIPRSERNIVES